MDETDNLGLPYIIAAQAQKHVTHNEALRMLDALVHLSVVDRDLAAPPVAPAIGARYMIASGASGAWTDHSGEIAAWQDGAWIFYMPQDGWVAWVEDEARLLVYDGAAWNAIDGGTLNPAPLVGVNATADATNKLAVASDASLFSHDNVTPGTGDHRMKVNKSAANKTASVLFQSNWSGRAEFGLTGDDDWHVKVSADGAAWKEALVVDRTSGRARFPNTNVTENLHFNLFEDAGRFAGSPEPASVTAGAFVQPAYLSPYNGSTFAAGNKFIHNNTTYGGTAGVLGADVDALIQKLRDAGFYRYGVEFHCMNVIAGSGTAISLNIGGTLHYLAMTNATVPIWPKSTVGINLKVTSGSVAINKTVIPGKVFSDGAEQSAGFALVPADGWKQLVFLHDRNPRQFFGYDNNLMQLHATPGAQFVLALPFNFPGWATVSTTPIGAVASLRAWR